MIPTVSIHVDVAPLIAELEVALQDQVPFAASQAINDTAKKIRDGEQEHLKGQMVIRHLWVARGIQVLRWSNKKDEGGPYAVIGILPEQGRLLDKFQAGGTKSPRGTNLAVPTIATQPSKQDIPSLALRPSKLSIDPETRKGNSRTFIIDKGPGAGLWQRVGPGPRGIRLLWKWQKSVRIPAILQFGTRAEPLLLTWFKLAFWKRLDEAIATRRDR
jgi:hypothetical protein